MIDPKAVERRFQELLERQFRLYHNTYDCGVRNRLYAQARAEIAAEAEAARQEAEAARQAAVQRARDREEQLASRLPFLTGKARAAAYTEICERLAAANDIRIDWRHPSQMPAGAGGAYARIRARIVVTPPIAGTDGEIEENAASCVHEIGHILAPPCRGGDHQRDPTETRWHRCLTCERLAWERAMELLPFTRRMFETLRWALGTYRRGTPGPASAVAALDRTRGTLTFAEHRQRRLSRRIDIKAAQLAWTLLTPDERLDREIADQRARRAAMRARGGTYAGF